MPIPLTRNLNNITTEIRFEKKLFDDDNHWMVWWYCGFYKNQKDNSQPNVLVAFRQLDSGKLSDNIRFQRIPITALGQFRTGTVWQRHICRYEADYDIGEFSVDFTENKWEYTSFFSQLILNSTEPYNQNIYPLKYEYDKSWLIKLPLSNGGKLLIPCIEFFSRCYGRSQELKRIISTYSWNDAKERLYAPLSVPEKDNYWMVKLKRRLTNGDVVFLSHAKYDTYTELQAKNIYAQLESHYDPHNKTPAFIKVAPWFQGPAQIRAKGIWFDDNRSFLCLNIIGCSNPTGVVIERDRENPNKTGKPAEKDGAGQDWNGTRERNLVNPPQIINLTGDDHPSHDGGAVEVHDPDFEILGEPREIIDVRHDQTSTSAGLRSHNNENDTYSSGEPHGCGTGIGYASIHARPVMESHGMLRDMWNALLYLKATSPELIQLCEWFTFDDGFQSDAEPKLIALHEFDENDNEVSSTIRNWLYLDKTTKTPRGILVAKVIAKKKEVYIVEIQRRQRNTKDQNGNTKKSEESFTGLIFMLNYGQDFSSFLRTLLSDIRYHKGVFKRIVGKYKNLSSTFQHNSSKHENVPCEAAVNQAFNKFGI